MHDYAMEVQRSTRRHPRPVAADRSAEGDAGAREFERCIGASAGFVGYCVSGPGIGYAATIRSTTRSTTSRRRQAGRSW